MYKHLLFACDLSEATESNFKRMLEYARPMHSQVTLFYAYDSVSVTQATLGHIDFSQSLTDIQLAVEEKAYIFLEAYRKKLNEADLLSESIVVSGHRGAQIVKTAENRHCDLIVVGSRSLEPLTRVLLGSTSTYVLHHSHCPVLVLPNEPT